MNASEAYTIKLKSVGSIIILIFLIFFVGCIENTENEHEVIIGIGTDISGYYPFIMRDGTTLSVNQNFFNPLVEIDRKTTGIIPSLADSWINPDNKTWRFYLRDDVFFHDGSKFTAEDVQYTLIFLKNSSFYSELLSKIDAISIIDSYTIEIQTTEPVPIFLYNLITINIISKHYMENVTSIEDYKPIGTGPYKLVDHVSNETITVERFEDYWKGTPDVSRFKYVIYNSYDSCIKSIQKEEIHLTSIPFRYASTFNSNKTRIESVETPYVLYISFDFRQNNSAHFKDGQNPVADKRIREAIYRSINVTELIDSKNGIIAGKPLTQFLTSHTFGYNPAINRLPYNISHARLLMKEAGYQEGFSITMDASDSNLSKEKVQIISNQLSLINITVIPHYLPAYEYLGKLYYKNTSMYLTSFSPLTAEGSIRLLLHTSDMEKGYGVWNYGNYSNSTIDQLYSMIEVEMASTLRNKYIQEVYEIATNDIAWVPLYSSKLFYIVHNELNWEPRHSGYIILDEISLKSS